LVKIQYHQGKEISKMALPPVALGSLLTSKLIIGGNPFSGFSHQNPQRDHEMVEYFTTARIKETLFQAEALGINTFIGRADRHIVRTLAEYWNEGGKIQWIAQTCPEFGGPLVGAQLAVRGGASSVYLHGGQMDFLYAQNRLDEAREAIQYIKSAGLPAGVAAHKAFVHQWANEQLEEIDFHMCSYYNPTPRDKNAAHVHGMVEEFSPADRDEMVKTIPTLRRPVIHYKIFAAGRTPPAEAIDFTAQHLRPQDAVCVGIFPKDNPAMLAEDLALLEKSLSRVKIAS
jgi:hypothetical protein